MCIELGVQVSGGAGRANDSAYGNSGPSGVVSAVGSLFPRGTKAIVAAHGSGRGAFGSGPGYQIRLFRYKFKLGKLAKHPWNSEYLAFSEGQVFRCVT
ncbi:hypothetical protein PIB30_033342 [Stylosanthes scabra]|uniref:Uncharacterized protein n=1 Tax=Stylosanthes scabra TaxID=79078 RepID=A0ABU6WDQ4_9FABA|nr:hypothetical protein [Stylosanthes scabra]